MACIAWVSGALTTAAKYAPRARRWVAPKDAECAKISEGNSEADRNPR